METIVKITWDKPEEQHWLNAYNIKIALSSYCKNTKFEVEELPQAHVMPRFKNSIQELIDSADIFCRCGHGHRVHSLSPKSHNFSAGRCLADNCDCKYFVHENLKK